MISEIDCIRPLVLRAADGKKKVQGGLDFKDEDIGDLNKHIHIGAVSH